MERGDSLEYIVGKIATNRRRFRASFAIDVMTKLYYLLTGNILDPSLESVYFRGLSHRELRIFLSESR